ncbi:hypothetical protein PTT_10464 [Pyrenophora teres f. teres 0-1]|uniref:DUF7918 domain-containing protein n=1 Tax=Pyrenophora teres f. teres (strain 0-1) TaxID=861557 RepID=E3RPB0_PYRTT|nr:hypothetical protein PTT_10464 [Pyrenophora teres f. teres 0-1]KAE8843783.1 hypothetical protein HRS9122_04886 [Pyrenophora teres f. teres]
MAITEAHPGIKVDIRVGGVPLVEYDDDDEQVQTSRDTLTKYIEATTVAEFVVNLVITPPWPGTSLLLSVYVDGQNICGQFRQQAIHYKGQCHQSSIEGAKYGQGNEWFLQKFCFSELAIDDSTASPITDKLMEDLKGMGTITIKVFRVKHIRGSNNGSLPMSTTTQENVPEKALKGRTLSHQSSLRPAVICPPTTTAEFTYVDPLKKPFAVFNFKYRSRAALKSLLIIPRSPSPVPLEERDINSLTAEESRELIRRLRERDEAAPLVKREGVKRERSYTVSQMEDYSDEVTFVSEKRRRLPVTLNEDGTEIIDLT